MDEFALIEKFFVNDDRADPSVQLGIGDDAAVLTIPAGQQLVISMDSLHQGIHFPEATPAFAIGYKAVAVNLSDLAAMGALPKYATLSLSIPEVEQRWLGEFSQGLFSALNPHTVDLVGGDFSRGPLSITLQMHGLLPIGTAILRSTANPGDLIYVSGQLGDAALALQVLKGGVNLSDKEFSRVLPALNLPQAQVAMGLALRGIATAMIDISDGLSNDLPRLLSASHCGAKVDLQKLPISDVLSDTMEAQAAFQCAFIGGDDYQLCFTAKPSAQQELARLSERLGVLLTQIGIVDDTKECHLLNSSLSYTQLRAKRFQHFKSSSCG